MPATHLLGLLDQFLGREVRGALQVDLSHAAAIITTARTNILRTAVSSIQRPVVPPTLPAGFSPAGAVEAELPLDGKRGRHRVLLCFSDIYQPALRICLSLHAAFHVLLTAPPAHSILKDPSSATRIYHKCFGDAPALPSLLSWPWLRDQAHRTLSSQAVNRSFYESLRQIYCGI